MSDHEELQGSGCDMNEPNSISHPSPNLGERWMTLTLRPRLSLDSLVGALPPHVEITPRTGSRWYTIAASFVIWLNLLAWSPWWTNAQFLGQCAGPVMLLWWASRCWWEGSRWRSNLAWALIWLVVGSSVYLLRSVL